MRTAPHRFLQRHPAPRQNEATRTYDDEGGFSTIEVVLLIPVFVALILLVVGLGRVEEARIDVTGAARDAARAASLSRTAPQATERASSGATVALAGSSVTCVGGPDVDVDTSAFVPGGAVTVQVSCPVRLGDLGLPGLPGTKTVTAQASSVIETYRSDP